MKFIYLFLIFLPFSIRGQSELNLIKVDAQIRHIEKVCIDFSSIKKTKFKKRKVKADKRCILLLDQIVSAKTSLERIEGIFDKKRVKFEKRLADRYGTLYLLKTKGYFKFDLYVRENAYKLVISMKENIFCEIDDMQHHIKIEDGCYFDFLYLKKYFLSFIKSNLDISEIDYYIILR